MEWTSLWAIAYSSRKQERMLVQNLFERDQQVGGGGIVDSVSGQGEGMRAVGGRVPCLGLEGRFAGQVETKGVLGEILKYVEIWQTGLWDLLHMLYLGVFIESQGRRQPCELHGER